MVIYFLNISFVNKCFAGRTLQKDTLRIFHIFIENWCDDVTKLTITRKIKIGKNLKFGFSFYSADCRSFINIWTQNFFSKFLFSKFLKFTWQIGNRLIRKKNQFSDFYDFYFSSYGHFSVIFLKKSPQFSMITRKIKIGKIFLFMFSFDSEHCAPFAITLKKKIWILKI